jgi:hypothetical protein
MILAAILRTGDAYVARVLAADAANEYLGFGHFALLLRTGAQGV